jgi:hypothetical protein
MVRWGFSLRAWLFAALFAHRAFCARLMRLRAEADRVRLGFVYELPLFNLPRTERPASTCLIQISGFPFPITTSSSV